MLPRHITTIKTPNPFGVLDRVHTKVAHFRQILRSSCSIRKIKPVNIRHNKRCNFNSFRMTSATPSSVLEYTAGWLIRLAGGSTIWPREHERNIHF